MWVKYQGRVVNNWSEKYWQGISLVVGRATMFCTDFAESAVVAGKRAAHDRTSLVLVSAQQQTRFRRNPVAQALKARKPVLSYVSLIITSLSILG
jgi:hypothetical protein